MQSAKFATLSLSLLMIVCSIASVTLALHRFSTIFHEGQRIDASIGWEIQGLSFQWWLAVCLAVRLTSQLIGTLRWRLVSLAALLCSMVLFVTWAAWSSQIAEAALHGVGITTSLLIGGNAFSKALFILVALGLILEAALLIGSNQSTKPGHTSGR